jgi:hypothetical protein
MIKLSLVALFVTTMATFGLAASNMPVPPQVAVVVASADLR